jgi:hypothetical protein
MLVMARIHEDAVKQTVDEAKAELAGDGPEAHGFGS